jgi:putative PIG3 family NAD(P)H quinone oxidoreductase
MKAVELERFGPPEVMRIGEVERPVPGEGQVLVAVAATSVNRPDVIQREGRYPPPPGDSEILGLEIAGTIVEGGAARGFAAGDRVLALVGGGAYAEYAVAHAGHVMRIPERLSFEQAACIPETYITAYMNVFRGARLGAGETALLHGGGGGVNTAAIQLCKALNPTGRVIVTASTGKVERVAALGADVVIDYRRENFAEAVLAATAGNGVDVILDHLGASYLESNLRALAVNGRLALIGTMGGRKAEIDLGRLMVKRQTMLGSVLRPRPVAEKAEIIAEFESVVMPLFASGRIQPVIDCVLPLEDVVAAHRKMEASEHFGKIVLKAR